MELKYTSPFEREPGIISGLLNQSYAELVQAQPELWESEKENWEEFDRNVFENPDTIGACTFLTWCGKDIVGFFSFDPRPGPADTRKMSFRYSQLCGTASDAVDAVGSAIPKGFKF